MSGAQDRDHHARQAGARRRRRAASPLPGHCALQRRDHRQAVEQMMRQHRRRVAHRRQVVDLVPLEDERAVGQQLLASARSLSARPSAAAPSRSASSWLIRRSCGGFGRRVAARRRDAPPFRRWISSSEMAAGVTPEMREARPRVSGRCLLSFCRTSKLRAGTWHVVEVGRQLQVLEMRRPLHLVLLPVDVAGVLGGDLDLLDLRLAAPSVTCDVRLAYLPPSSDISAA